MKYELIIAIIFVLGVFVKLRLVGVLYDRKLTVDYDYESLFTFLERIPLGDEVPQGPRTIG